MKGYTAETIRNVALLGHGGSGKTTFPEAALLATGVISRLGKVEDGSTVSDYDKTEIEKDIPSTPQSFLLSSTRLRSTSLTLRDSSISQVKFRAH